MALGEWLATVDALLMETSGERVAVLHATRDFWDDPDDDVIEAAEAEIEVAHEAVRSALTARWGESEKVDLAPYLWADEPVPEPVGQLAAFCGSMLVWRPAVTDRWVGLAAGQHDAEFPIQLVVAVGDTPIG
jgi:hypothetical protein